MYLGCIYFGAPWYSILVLVNKWQNLQSKTVINPLLLPVALYPCLLFGLSIRFLLMDLLQNLPLLKTALILNT